MGLDSVEMVIAVEDRFGIYIPDDLAYNCETVGDLKNLVLMLLAGKASGKCLTQTVFYRLRKSISFTQRGSLSPSGRLRDLVSDEAAAKAYAEIEMNLGLRLPNLVEKDFYDWRLMLMRLVFILLLIFLLGFITIIFEGVNPTFMSILFGGLLLTSVCVPPLMLSDPPRVVPNQHIRQFVEQIVAINYNILSPEADNEKAIFDKLQKLIVKSLGVDADEVSLSAHFRNDLGMD